MVPIFPDPKATEEIREIAVPDSIDCYILTPNTRFSIVLAAPEINSRRLFLMTNKDVVPILDTEGDYYRIRTIGGVEGFVLREHGMKVKVGRDEVKEQYAWGFFRVNEFLIGWKSSKLPFKLQDAPIKTGPYFRAPELARIKSDIILPVVGETYGWYEVQLPSYFRGWIPEAYGYRMLSSNSLPDVSRPLSAADIIAGIAGVVGVVTLVGVGAAVSAISDDL